MEIARNFSHRTFGAIGSVTLTVPKGKWMIDGKELPEVTIAHLANFALQTLQDAYAGSKDLAEAQGAFNGKLDKLLEGTIGTRGSGDGADERTRVARSVTMAVAKANMGAKSEDWAKFTGLSDAEQAAKLDEWYAENEETLSAAVDEEIEARRAKAARKATLAGSVKIGL